MYVRTRRHVHRHAGMHIFINVTTHTHNTWTMFAHRHAWYTHRHTQTHTHTHTQSEHGLSNTEKAIDSVHEFVKATAEGNSVLSCDDKGQLLGGEFGKGTQQAVLVLWHVVLFQQLVHQLLVLGLLRRRWLGLSQGLPFKCGQKPSQTKQTTVKLNWSSWSLHQLHVQTCQKLR